MTKAVRPTQHNSTLPARPQPIPRSSRSLRSAGTPKKVNRKRKALAFAHAYHSRERVAFVKAMPCLVCASVSPFFADATAGRSENAHTGKKPGMKLKAHYSTIVPLCASHHRRYDEYLAPLDDPSMRERIAAFASRVEAAWLTHTGD